MPRAKVKQVSPGPNPFSYPTRLGPPHNSGMHDAPAPPPNKNSPAVMAARLMRYVTDVSSFADQHLETDPEPYKPRPTSDRAALSTFYRESADAVRSEAEGKDKAAGRLTGTGRTATEQKPKKVQHRYSKTLLTHIRRVEYQLRCFILWLSGILIEKAQDNPDFLTSLFNDPRASSLERVLCEPGRYPGSREHAEMMKAQLAGVSGDQQHSSKLIDHPQVTTQAQAVEPEARNKAEQSGGRPDQIPNLIWKQELELRRLTAKTYPIGGFTVTTPVIENKRRRSRRRVRRLRRDPLELMDAGYLLARMARLPRILKRADLMAERLARRALLASSGHPVRSAGQSPALQTRDLRQETRVSVPGPAAHHPMLRCIRDDTIVSVSRAKHTPPNPLFFEPFRRWMPPDTLWQSTEDEDERGDMSWLHYVASDTLSRTGFSPGPDPGSRLPDLSRFEPPSPPQIRAT